jgi:hypothetical protein
VAAQMSLRVREKVREPGENNQFDRAGEKKASMMIFPPRLAKTVMRLTFDRASAVVRTGSQFGTGGDHEDAISHSLFLRPIRTSRFGCYHTISYGLAK